MSNYLGIIFAIFAALFWTIGDFSIQKVTRTLGDWKALFFIGLVGFVGLFPFITSDLLSLLNPVNFLLFFLLGFITLISALFLFEALQKGKLSIIEPVFGLELPLTVAFSIVLGGEKLSFLLYLIIILIFIGLLLSVTKEWRHLHFHKTFFEKGVVLAGIGSIGMGLMNFLTGHASQQISPLFTIWFTHSFLMVVCFCYFLYKGEVKNLLSDIRNNPKIILMESIFDNCAWIFYALSMSLAPISIGTAIGESYIVLTVLVGVFFNREKLRFHQGVGVILALLGITGLSLAIIF